MQYSVDAGRFKTFRTVPGDVASEMVEGFAINAILLNRLDRGQDRMPNRQDRIVTEIRGPSSHTRDMLDSGFERIENDISEIRSRLQI